MRRPKGIKTKKSVAKRFKITASGKVLRSRRGQAPFAAGQETQAPAIFARHNRCAFHRRISHQAEHAVQSLKI